MSVLVVASIGLVALLWMYFMMRAVMRWPALGAFGAYSVILIQWDFPNQSPIVVVGGTAIFFPDVMALLLLATALGQFKVVLRNIGWLVVPWGVFTVCVLFSVIRGVSEFGLGPAANEGRLLLLPLAAVTWSLSLTWTESVRRRVLLVPLEYVGWALVIIAFYHAMRFGVGTATSNFIEVDGIAQSGRILTQLQALTLAFAALATIWKWSQTRSKRHQFSFVVFVLVIVVSQQRTVWSALAVGLVGLIFIGQVRLRAAILTMAAVGLSAGILTVVLFPNSALVVGLLNSFSDQTTYEARLSSWPQLIESSVRSGDLSVWFGQSFGSGFVRREPNGVVVSYSPHNWYLLLFLRVGLIGLVSFVTAMCWVLLRLIARRDPTPAVSFILTMSVFGWSYGITWALCVPFGWALAAAYSPGVPSDLTLRGARSSSYVGAPQDLRRVSPFDREPSRVNQDAK